MTWMSDGVGLERLRLNCMSEHAMKGELAEVGFYSGEGRVLVQNGCEDSSLHCGLML